MSVCFVCVCAYSCLSYPGCVAHAPYYIVICNPSGSTIFFPHFLKTSMIFGEKVIEHKMCVLIFSTFV